jgi:hypothetical protein
VRFGVVKNILPMPMTKEVTLSRNSSKLNMNQTPRKAIIETLLSYSRSLQFVDTSIGKIVVVNN